MLSRLIPLVLVLTFALIAGVAFERPAVAQGTERLGDFGDWSAFKFTENGATACYMASEPIKAEGQYTKRGAIYALVTHRPAEGRRDEVSFVAGYSYKKDSAVEIRVGKSVKKLFTQDDTAWAADKDTDQALVKAMIRGNDMVVSGMSERGTKTKDTYSLKGFTKAYKAMDKHCPK